MYVNNSNVYGFVIEHASLGLNHNSAKKTLSFLIFLEGLCEGKLVASAKCTIDFGAT